MKLWTRGVGAYDVKPMSLTEKKDKSPVASMSESHPTQLEALECKEAWDLLVAHKPGTCVLFHVSQALECKEAWDCDLLEAQWAPVQDWVVVGILRPTTSYPLRGPLRPQILVPRTRYLLSQAQHSRMAGRSTSRPKCMCTCCS